MLAKFKSTGFWRTLYKIGFMRRYLHRVAGKKLPALRRPSAFPRNRRREARRRRREIPAGGQGALRHRLRTYRDCAAAGRCRALAGAARVRPVRRARASNCGWRISIPIPVRAKSWRIRPASRSAILRIPKPRRRYLRPTAGSGRATSANSTRTDGLYIKRAV